MNIYYGYARVSTKEQSDNSIDNQLAYLEEKSKELGYDFQGISEKQSGKSVSSRSGLLSIVDRVKVGDYVGFYDNSRLGRNTTESLEIVDKIINKGGNVQVGGKTIDKNSARDELLLTIESAISTFYLKEQKLKSRIGMDQTKKNGKWLFTSRLYGYNLSYQGSTPIVSIVEEEANVLQYIFEQYAQGKSILWITNSINSRGFRSREEKEFNVGTVRRYIHKPIYKGYYKVEGAGGHKNQDQKALKDSELVKSVYYPPIIEEELWDRVQDSYKYIRRNHSIQFEYRYSYYELTGILKCYHCLKLGKKSGYVHSYIKSKYSDDVREVYCNYSHFKKCGQSFYTFRAEILESVFRVCFCLVFADKYELDHYLEEKKNEYESEVLGLNNDLERINEAIQGNMRKKQSLLDAVERGLDLDDIMPRLNRLKEEHESLETEREQQKYRYQDQEEHMLVLTEQYSEDTLISFLLADEPAQKRKFYQEMIEHAYVYNKRIIIRFMNSKVFVIPLFKNRGRYVQRQFEITVGFKGKKQFSVLYDNETEIFDLTEVHYHYHAETERDKIFQEESKIRYEKKIDDLKSKIEEYSVIREN